MAVDYDLVVCGDSFCCSTDIELKLVGSRAHFSQILEDRWGYRVLNLAHGGVGNTCILWQIREAMSLKPRAIVYNRTFEGRPSIMLHDDFQPEHGLRNFAYWERDQVSYKTGLASSLHDDKPAVLSTTWEGLEQRSGITQQQVDATKTWLQYFFNWSMMGEMSDWLFEYWHTRIQQAGIQALPFQHTRIGKVAWDFSYQHQEYDCPFHTDRATQEVVAQNIHDLITSGTQLNDGYLWMSRNWDTG